ncbi:type II toxin-antitoxin system HipA family toxin, partial [Rhizobium brockwellii]
SDQAIAIVSRQIETIGAQWLSLCDEAGLGKVDRALFWGRQFLNTFAFYELEGPAAVLAERAAKIRGQV